MPCKNQFAVNVQVLYGLKFSGAAWCAHLAMATQEVNFILLTDSSILTQCIVDTKRE
jgi:hypothetical protein